MDSYILLILSIALIVLGIAVIAFAYFYLRMVKRLSSAQKENVYLRFHMQEKGLHKVNQAKDKAMKIIQDATTQADEIIKKTQFVEADASQAFKKQLEELTQKQKEALEKASEALTTSFSEAVTDIEQQDANLVKSAADQINKAAEDQVTQFKDQLAQETISSEKSIDEKIQEAFKNAQLDIEKYKTERIEKIDREMMHVLSEVTKDLIGKRLNYEDHKDLINASLEKAKTQMQITT